MNLVHVEGGDFVANVEAEKTPKVALITARSLDKEKKMFGYNKTSSQSVVLADEIYQRLLPDLFNLRIPDDPGLVNLARTRIEHPQAGPEELAVNMYKISGF